MSKRRHKYAVNKRMLNTIQQYGQSFEPATLPAEIRRGAVGVCFDWCAMETARLYSKYKYVEGIATDPDNPEYGILHAWLTDGVHAFDPTWRAEKDIMGVKVEVPVPSKYYGIIMDINLVAKFMRDTGLQGVIGNRNVNRALADKVIASGQHMLY